MGTFSYIQEGKMIPYTPSGSAVTAGDIVDLGDCVGVAPADIADGALGDLQTEGVFECPCLGTDVVTAGEHLWWDAGNTRATKTASTHQFLGTAWGASANGVTTVRVKINWKGSQEA